MLALSCCVPCYCLVLLPAVSRPALLCVRRQDRKDKEKDKRVRGQSTHSQWKSEAEMVLRQQFD